MSKSIFTLIFIFLCSAVFSQSNLEKEANELLEKKEYKKALEKFKLLAGMYPDRSSFYEGIGGCLYELKDYKNSILVLTEGINKFNDSAHLYQTRASFLNSFGLFKEAISDYDVVIDLTENDSTKAEILSYRGSVYSSIRDFTSADRDLKKAFNLDSNSMIVLNNYALVLDNNKEYVEGIRILKKMISKDSTFKIAWVNLGFIHQKIDRHDLSIQYFDKYIKISPDSPFGYSNRAYSYYHINEYKKALKDINKSISLYPSNSYAFWVKAKILLKQGKKKAACGALIEARELDYETTYGSEVNDLLKLHCK